MCRTLRRWLCPKGDGYVLVFTTLPQSHASAPYILECYRLRWQIELTFKRLKSILQLGHVPKQDDQSGRAWLYGNLFVALLSRKLVRVGSTISPWGYYLVGQSLRYAVTGVSSSFIA
jgi:hypothetical protein